MIIKYKNENKTKNKDRQVIYNFEVEKRRSKPLRKKEIKRRNSNLTT